MSRRTIVLALLSSLALSAGACKSSLGPNLGAIAATNAVDTSAVDDHGGDRVGGQGRGGADDPANHH